MALTAQGYFNCLKSYFNTDHCGEPQASKGEIALKETRRLIWIRMASPYSAITRFATTAMPTSMAWRWRIWTTAILR